MTAMPERFNPYHAWLGIAPSEQPPNHYRLLAVALFEDDDVVLSHAADRQMQFVRQFQSGLHQAESQRLLNEIATAKVCLLDPAAKAAYDQSLKAAIVPPSLPIGVADDPPAVNQSGLVTPVEPGLVEQGGAGAGAFAKQRKRRRRRAIFIGGHVVASAVGLLIGWMILQQMRVQQQAGRIDVPVVEDDSILPAHASNATARRSNGPSNDLVIDRPAVVPQSPTPPAFDDLPADTPVELPGADQPGTPADSIALLTEKRNTALSNGDLRAALATTSEIASSGGEDQFTAQLAVLEGFRQLATEKEKLLLLAEEALRLFDIAEEQKRADAAQQLAEIALVAARKSEEGDLIRRSTLAVLRAKDQSPHPEEQK